MKCIGLAVRGHEWAFSEAFRDSRVTDWAVVYLASVLRMNNPISGDVALVTAAGTEESRLLA